MSECYIPSAQFANEPTEEKFPLLLGTLPGQTMRYLTGQCHSSALVNSPRNALSKHIYFILLRTGFFKTPHLQASDNGWPQNLCLLYLTPQSCLSQASDVQLCIEFLPAIFHSLIFLVLSSWHTCSITLCKITAHCISLLNCTNCKLWTYNFLQNHSLLYLTP